MQFLSNLKEKFNNLSAVGKAVVLITLAVILGGSCYMGYNAWNGRPLLGGETEEEKAAAAKAEKGKTAKGKLNPKAVKAKIPVDETAGSDTEATT